MPVVDPNWAREAGKYQLLAAPDPSKRPITSKRVYIGAAVLVGLILLGYLFLSGALWPKEKPTSFFAYGDAFYTFNRVHVPELPEGFVMAGYATMEEQEDGTSIALVDPDAPPLQRSYVFYANPELPDKAYVRPVTDLHGQYTLLKKTDRS